jgi:hypothetical protein
MKIQGVPEERYLNKNEVNLIQIKNQNFRIKIRGVKDKAFFLIQISTIFRLVFNFCA